jgi:predicted DNA-binding ribbon-helix-helix protein
MQSAVVKRSIVVAGHKTSVSLEDAFWNGLKEIGRGDGRGDKMTLSDLVAGIDTRRLHGNLSSAIRLFVLDHFRAQLSATATDRVGAGMEMPRSTQDGGQSQQLNGRRPTGEHPLP